MRRTIFLTSSAALVVTGVPREIRAGTLVAGIENAERWSEGSLSVVAQRVDGDEPFVSYKPHVPASAASTIKLVIMATVFQLADDEPSVLERHVDLRAADRVGGSETFAAARAGRAYPIGEVLHAMIAQSDNTAANMLVTAFGFERINATAQQLGMTQTHLRRHFSDDPAVWRHPENTTSAADMAMLMLGIARGASGGASLVASSAACKRMIAILLDQEDRTKIAAGLPHGTRLADKTGEISHVRNDVGLVAPGTADAYVLSVFAHRLAFDGRGDAAIARVTRLVDPRLREHGVARRAGAR